MPSKTVIQKRAEELPLRVICFKPDNEILDSARNAF